MNPNVPSWAIVLCGGLGTRLGELTRRTPKPMLQVAGRPFLAILLERLGSQGIRKVCLAVSYLASNFQDHFGDSFCGMDLIYSVEKVPLGTGGGLLQALQTVREREAVDRLWGFNGDTFLDLDLLSMLLDVPERDWAVLIATTDAAEADRYERLRVEDHRITGTIPRGVGAEGPISAGAYLLNARHFNPLPVDAASFETDILPSLIKAGLAYAHLAPGFFIDIGVPEILASAQEIFRREP